MRYLLDLIARLLNEFPTIAVGIWALLRVFGVEVDGDAQESLMVAVESAGALVLMLLYRANNNGPVTLLKRWSSSEAPASERSSDEGDGSSDQPTRRRRRDPD